MGCGLCSVGLVGQKYSATRPGRETEVALIKDPRSQAWWHMYIISALENQRQQDGHKFKASPEKSGGGEL